MTNKDKQIKLIKDLLGYVNNDGVNPNVLVSTSKLVKEILGSLGYEISQDSYKIEIYKCRTCNPIKVYEIPALKAGETQLFVSNITCIKSCLDFLETLNLFSDMFKEVRERTLLESKIDIIKNTKTYHFALVDYGGRLISVMIYNTYSDGRIRTVIKKENEELDLIVELDNILGVESNQPNANDVGLSTNYIIFEPEHKLIKNLFKNEN